MFLSVNILLHWHGPSNKIRPWLQPETTQVMAVLVINIAAKGIVHVAHYLQDGAL